MTIRRVRPKDTTCGVIITDGQFLLLGHATRSPRWDIPKGVAEPGEEFEEAARRELQEETGLVAPDELRPLGVYQYRRDKDLALFGWQTPTLPNPRDLVCVACFEFAGQMFPEFDRFGLFSRDEAVARVGKGLARILAGISLDPLQPASG